ncbi:hypothetical protein ES708_31514 [subsurface metagenome]
MVVLAEYALIPEIVVQFVERRICYYIFTRKVAINQQFKNITTPVEHTPIVIIRLITEIKAVQSFNPGNTDFHIKTLSVHRPSRRFFIG